MEMSGSRSRTPIPNASSAPPVVLAVPSAPSTTRKMGEDELVDAQEPVGQEEGPFSPVKTRAQKRAEAKAKENAGQSPNVKPVQKEQQQKREEKAGKERGTRASERVRDARDNGHALRAAYAAYDKESKVPLEKPEEGNFEQRVERNTDRVAVTAKHLNHLMALFIEDHNKTSEDVKMLRGVMDDYIRIIGPAEEQRKLLQSYKNQLGDLEQRVTKLETEKMSKAEVESQLVRANQELAAVNLQIQKKSFADTVRWGAQSQPNSAPVGYSQPAKTHMLSPKGVFPATKADEQREWEAIERAGCEARITNLPGNANEIKEVAEELKKAAENMDDGHRVAASEAAELLKNANIVSQFPGTSPKTTTYYVRFRNKTEKQSFTAERVWRAFASKGIGITWVRTSMQMRRWRVLRALEKDAKDQGHATAWVKAGYGSRLRINGAEVDRNQIEAKYHELVSETTERTNRAGLGVSQSSA